MIEILLWSSLCLLGYTYVGYPIVLWAWATIRPRDVRRAPQRPQVSIIMAVHNEEQILRDKLENLLRLDYPRELLQILVVSDHSTDATVSLAREYADRGYDVKPAGSDGHGGADGRITKDFLEDVLDGKEPEGSAVVGRTHQKSFPAQRSCAARSIRKSFAAWFVAT